MSEMVRQAQKEYQEMQWSCNAVCEEESLDDAAHSSVSFGALANLYTHIHFGPCHMTVVHCLVIVDTILSNTYISQKQ